MKLMKIISEIKAKPGNRPIETSEDLLHWANNNKLDLLKHFRDKFDYDVTGLENYEFEINEAGWIYMDDIENQDVGVIELALPNKKKFADFSSFHKDEFNGVKFRVAFN